MIQNKMLLGLCIVFAQTVTAQCDTTDVSGNMIVSSSTFMSGVYRITGKFQVTTGTTVFVQPYSTNSCGSLEIIASEIVIDGSINGDYAGFPGGTGGAPGQSVNSLTGDQTAINSCSNKDNTGLVQLSGGESGLPGSGPGASAASLAGGIGSGPKQICLNSSDEPGMIAGSGGAGGGAGASYGGAGSTGGNGGAGSSDYVASGLSVSSAYPVQGGTGGASGSAGAVYGTLSGMDIQLGSGGTGAGGGGRSFDIGLGGGNGGNGGGSVILRASTDLEVSGTISVDGANGQAGGDGGNGGATAKCCSDGCDDCGEATLSTGSGGAGGAGGGSGGGILLFADSNASITGTLSVKGGNGGDGGARGNGVSCNYSATFCGSQSLTSNNGNPGQPGGAGGGGRIKVFVPICSAAVINPTTALTAGTGNGSAGNGTYFLGCSELSVMELASSYKLDIYPNPTTDQVSLTTSSLIENAEVRLIDLSGRTVYSNLHSLSSDPITISLENLSSGTYQLFLNWEGNSIVKKLIKN
ncbi:T9SS type A sorting domain-containing protein [Fluviicola taffensis]|uniref:T9SS type A sorting domain-containing protein n=1 Tax=Fluviicola taffensis TaxID=191579 RepID=UPI003137CD8A